MSNVSCSWVKVALSGAAISARRFASSITYGSRTFLFGGQTSSRLFHADLFAFDGNAKTVELLAPTGEGPSPRASHSATLVGNEMYVYGGLFMKQALGDMYVLNLDTLVWRRVTFQGDVVPTARYHHQCIAHLGRLYVFGGALTHSSYSNELFIFTPATGAWEHATVSSPVRPTERAGMLAVDVGDGNVFMYGGYAGDGGFKYFSDGFMLNLGDSAATFSEIDVSGRCPGTARTLTGDLVVRRDGSRHVLVFGGFDGRTPSAECYDLDLATLTWTTLEMWAAMMESGDMPSMATSSKGLLPFARYGHCMYRVAAEESFVAYYVTCGAGSTYLSDTFELALEFEEPRETEPLFP